MGDCCLVWEFPASLHQMQPSQFIVTGVTGIRLFFLCILSVCFYHFDLQLASAPLFLVVTYWPDQPKTVHVKHLTLGS